MATCQLCTFSQVEGRHTPIELKGNFVSQQGVMSDNSCFGFNIGELYITNGSSEEVKVICFDRMDYSAGAKIYCKLLSVKGYYETKKIDSNNSCKAGSKEIFYVTSYTCLD